MDLCASLPTCHDYPVDLGGYERQPRYTHMRRRRSPIWLYPLLCLVFGLLYPMVIYLRYGPGWVATWGVAALSSALPTFLIKPATWRTWPRRHSSWAFAYFVLLLTTMFFAFIALLFGIWLSPWWCLVISLGAGVLTIARIWPAQLRFYKMQRSPADTGQEHRKSGSANGTSFQ